LRPFFSVAIRAILAIHFWAKRKLMKAHVLRRAAAAAASAFCVTLATPAVAKLPSVAICIENHPIAIQAEVANTDTTRARGLMMREHLGEHEGMLFSYPSERPGDNGFWMYNTWIPLDIAYLDSQRRIVKLIQMQPCDSIDPSRCPVYRPYEPYQGALEMNIGYFAKYNISVGAQVNECAAQ